MTYTFGQAVIIIGNPRYCSSDDEAPGFVDLSGVVVEVASTGRVLVYVYGHDNPDFDGNWYFGLDKVRPAP